MQSGLLDGVRETGNAKIDIPMSWKVFRLFCMSFTTYVVRYSWQCMVVAGLLKETSSKGEGPCGPNLLPQIPFLGVDQDG